jgi:hypothetical protein
MALAAPDRLGDGVPDAFPDKPRALSFGYSHESIQLEGPLTEDRVAHDYFRLRYTLNPRTAVSFRYGSHDLTGGLGLTTPLFDNRDGAESYTLDLNLNLLTVPATPADPDKGVEYSAGSAFGLGISGTQYQSDMNDLASDDSLLRAYLVYTSDLSPEMRAHTIFSTARLTGDNQSGSVNRVGAGLDYTLIGGRRPLVLMANGVLDVYNFREPQFNTSRVSRFDVGLRYRVAEDWYASVGYITVNDSEDDSSGSGIYAGVQFVDEPSPPKPECPEVEEEAPADQGEAPPEPTAGDQPPAQASAAIPAEQPALMAVVPAPDSDGPVAEDVAETGSAATAAAAEPDAGSAADTDGPDWEMGVEIPPFPEQRPRHTPAGAMMARAGLEATPPHPHHTRPEDVLQRPPVADLAATIGDLVADAMENADGETPGVLAIDSESIIADSATATETSAEESSRAAAAAGG